MAYDVFISYSSKDKPAADATCAVLEAEGIRCWIAPRDILPGQEWGASIVKAIANVKIFVLLLSSNANTSPQISREVERAVNHAIPVIPVRIEDVTPTASLEYFINTPHWLDAFKPPLDEHLAYLARVVRTLLDGGDTPPPPPGATTARPPPGSPTAPPAAQPAAAPPTPAVPPTPAAASVPAPALVPAPVAVAAAAQRSGSLAPILVGVAVLFLLIGVALAAWRFLPRPSNTQVASGGAAQSSIAPANVVSDNNGVPQAAPSIAPQVDPSCLAEAPSVPSPDNCQAMLNQNPTWQGCAASYADGDMGALTSRAQSLIAGGHSGVDLYEASPDFKSYGTISHYWEMLSQCVHEGDLSYDQLSGNVPFPESFWTKTRPLRAVIGQNWQGANQALPDFMSNFQYLCQQYKAARDSERPGGGDSLDCSS